MNEVVPIPIRKERSKILHLLSDRKKRFFYEKNKGSMRKVLFEEEDHQGYLHGFTENYIKIKTPYIADWTNTFRQVELKELDRDGLYKSPTESTLEIL